MCIDLTCVHVCDYSEFLIGFCFCRFIILNTHTPLSVFPFQSPAHTPSVSPVQQASHSPSITSHVKPSRFTRSSVSSVQQASSITSPVKPSSFTRSSVSPVRQVSHSPSVTSPVKPSTFTCSQYLQFGPHLTVLQPQIHL